MPDSPASPLLTLMSPAQWAQLGEAIGLVEASGFGEVRLVFEDGHPAFLFVTVARLYLSLDQLAPALSIVQRSGKGDVGVIVRNGRPTRLEVTTEAKMVAPPTNGRTANA